MPKQTSNTSDSAASPVKVPAQSTTVFRRIKAEFEQHFAQSPTAAGSELGIDEGVLGWLTNVLSSKDLSYRDAVVIQLAYWLAQGTATDVTVRHEGGRSVAGSLGKFLRAHHIRAVSDSFQNIGKNSVELVRGNNVSFDNILKWASAPSRTPMEIEAIFRFACSRIAANARPVLALPPLDRSKLTFTNTCLLLSALYEKTSAGAYEQFSIAALIHALVEQQGQSSFRVETKNLNASDKSSGTAGDIQLMVGNRVVEAIEVTANDWREKLANAAKTIKDNDLSRLTIVANGVTASGSSLFRELASTELDLSVLDVQSFAQSMVAALTRQGRASAITRFYELLDRLQPDVAVVNQLVTSLVELSLCEKSAATP